MRITAGIYKNATIRSPKTTKTHPMSEQMRSAIFNTLGDITGLTVCDAYAGSGAVGLEAASHGAAAVTFIEADRVANRVIAENIATLGITAANIHTTVHNWLETSDTTFDIIVADPPYHDLHPTTISALYARVAPGGIFVLSWPGKQALPELSGLVRQRGYGDSQLAYYTAA